MARPGCLELERSSRIVKSVASTWGVAGRAIIGASILSLVTGNTQLECSVAGPRQLSTTPRVRVVLPPDAVVIRRSSR